MRDLPRYLTPEDLAQMLQLRPRTVLKMARKSGLRCVRFGNKIRFAEDEVARWLQARGGAA